MLLFDARRKWWYPYEDLQNRFKALIDWKLFSYWLSKPCVFKPLLTILHVSFGSTTEVPTSFQKLPRRCGEIEQIAFHFHFFRHGSCVIWYFVWFCIVSCLRGCRILTLIFWRWWSPNSNVKFLDLRGCWVPGKTELQFSCWCDPICQSKRQRRGFLYTKSHDHVWDVMNLSGHGGSNSFLRNSKHWREVPWSYHCLSSSRLFEWLRMDSWRLPLKIEKSFDFVRNSH